MVYCCMVWGCQNRPDREDCRSRGVSFHRLPVSDLNLLKSWVAKIGVTNYPLSRNLRICSEHFELDNFVVHKDGRRVLKRTAVPSLFNFPADNVQAMFPAFPLHNLSTEDLRALKAEPTTPNSMAAKMAAAAATPDMNTPANLSMKTDPTEISTETPQQLATTRWSLLPDGKNMIDSPYSLNEEIKPIVEKFEDSPVNVAETASSTVSTNNGQGNGATTGDSELATSSPLVVVNGGDMDGIDGGVDGTTAEPLQKRYRATPPTSVNGDQNHDHFHQSLLLAKFHQHQHLNSNQIRRPRQRKSAVPRQSRASPPLAPAQPSPQQQQQTQQQAFLNLLNGANFLQVLQQQQDKLGSNPLASLAHLPAGALDLSVRNLPTPASSSSTSAGTNSLPVAPTSGRVPSGPGDIGRVRSLIAGYRESASFLTKAADELETFVSHVQTLAAASVQPSTPVVTSASATMATLSSALLNVGALTHLGPQSAPANAGVTMPLAQPAAELA